MSIGEEGGGEEDRHAVSDLGEAGSEDTVLVKVEAVGFLGAGDMLAGDAELLGGIEDGLGAVDPAGLADPEREASAVGDNGILLRLEGENGDRGVPEDGEVADVAPEVGDGADAEGRGRRRGGGSEAGG